MASYEQIATALRNADRAGDAAAAVKLAGALKAMQAPPAQPIAQNDFNARFAGQPDRGAMDAAARGFGDMASFGFSDEISAGLRSGFGMAGDYGKELSAVRERNTQAQTDHPIAYGVGEVAGIAPSLLVPGGGAASLGKLAVRGAGMGAAYGGLYGAGSSDGSLTDRAISAGTGAVLGAGVGAAAPYAVRGIGAAARAVSAPFRAIAAPEAEAARRVGAAITRDTGGQQFVNDLTQAGQSGVPLAAVDAGTTTRGLARSAANTSPEGRAALNATVDSRFQSQTDRALAVIRNNSPAGGQAGDILDQLQTAARKANAPAYSAAYARPIQSTPGIAAALQTPSGSMALRQAQKLAANEGAKIDPANLDTRALDYVKRALDDQISSAQRGGQKEAARAVSGVRAQILADLDRQNPAYKAARSGAAQFFGAQDALEAGSKFVTSKASNAEAAKALAKMSMPERALFAEGFATDLMDRLREVGDRRSVINSIFLSSPAARERIQMALGKQAATRLETFLRVENIMDIARRELQGNSTTARQLAELGLAGGAGFYLGGGNIYDPKSWFSAAIGAGARKGLYKIDGKVAQRVAEMLASSDPQVVRKAVETVSRQPAFMGAIRRLEQTVSRLAGPLVPQGQQIEGQSGGRPLEITVDSYAGAR